MLSDGRTAKCGHCAFRLSLAHYPSMRLRQFNRLLRLGAALFVAGVVSWKSPETAMVKIWRALTFWARFVRKHERADFWRTFRRYRACRNCSLFYRPLRTCGSPLNSELSGVGCYCNMETKCGIKSAECWLIENEHSELANPRNVQRWSD